MPPTKGKKTASPTPKKSTAKAAASKSGQAGDRERSPLPVVGSGASAGGIEALDAFFPQVPEDCGMAFVVVVHMSHSHASILPELLQRYTKLAVHQAENGMPRSAIDTGLIDFILPPEKMAEQLLSYTRHSARKPVSDKLADRKSRTPCRRSSCCCAAT